MGAQIAALWALRNFCLIDLYRARMPSIGVLELCLRLLDAGRAGPGVQHAAASVLQMLSIAEPATIKLISDQHALPKLASFLYGKHRRAAAAIVLRRASYGLACLACLHLQSHASV